MQNTLRNKNLYKIFLSLIKYVPTILALFKITSLTLSYFEITSFAVTCVGGTSILFLILLYLIASIFRFCGLYRISLNYVSTVTAITVLDWYFNLPLDMASRYLMYAVITGVFIVTWVIYWYKNRNNPKIDHIKQLCDSYC
jgi:hypothetical protein